VCGNLDSGLKNKKREKKHSLDNHVSSPYHPATLPDRHTSAINNTSSLHILIPWIIDLNLQVSTIDPNKRDFPTLFLQAVDPRHSYFHNKIIKQPYKSIMRTFFYDKCDILETVWFPFMACVATENSRPWSTSRGDVYFYSYILGPA
jgi:hypothetical protein